MNGQRVRYVKKYGRGYGKDDDILVAVIITTRAHA